MTAPYNDVLVSTWSKYAEAEFERGKRIGLQDATSICLNPFSYGEKASNVIVVRGATRREIRDKMLQFRWRRSGDNPGQAYMGDFECLRHYRANHGFEAIVVVSTYYDV